ncbi:MAG: hypothetical protein ACRCXY_07550 [Fusobacteriaceae bacterium]
MRKLPLTLIGALAISTLCFAGINDKKEHTIENIMAKNLSSFKDGAATVQVKDLDVDVDGFKTKVEVELYEGSENTSPAALQAYAKDLADTVRKELANENKVLIKIEVDRDGFLGDKTLLKSDF